MQAEGMIEPGDPDESALPGDPSPGSDPERAPRPRKPPVDPDVRPDAPAGNAVVTPLDEEKHIKDGIEVDET
jgi:hypothetical protein